jgi:hypothetical protein
MTVKKWGRDLPSTTPGAYDANKLPLNAQEWPRVMKYLIPHAAALMYGFKGHKQIQYARYNN